MMTSPLAVSMVSTLVAAVVVLTLVQEATSSCCLPSQWEGKSVLKVEMTSHMRRERKRAVASNISVDFTAGKMAVDEVIFGAGRKPMRIGTFVDFNASAAWVVDFARSKCRKFPLNATMERARCLPPNATLASSITLGLEGGNGIAVDTYIMGMKPRGEDDEEGDEGEDYDEDDEDWVDDGMVEDAEMWQAMAAANMLEGPDRLMGIDPGHQYGGDLVEDMVHPNPKFDMRPHPKPHPKPHPHPHPHRRHRSRTMASIMVTHADCVPVSEHVVRFSRVSHAAMSALFYDIKGGIQDPGVFTPPSFCGKTQTEDVDFEHPGVAGYLIAKVTDQ